MGGGGRSQEFSLREVELAGTSSCPAYLPQRVSLITGYCNHKEDHGKLALGMVQIYNINQ